MLNHLRFGKGNKVLLQHGFLGGSGYWLPVIADFAKMFDVIAPDLPGFAGSADEKIPSSISGYASALIEFVDLLEVDRFSLVGHSMGGMIAQQVAIDYPDRIQRLVLYGTAPSGNLPTRFETFENTIKRFEAMGADAAGDVVASWFVERRDHPFYNFTADAGRGFKVAAATNAMTFLPKWDVRDRLKNIKAETLVITADRDFAATPDHSMAIWKAIPNSHLCIVPGASHNIHLEKSAVFNELVGKFLLMGR